MNSGRGFGERAHESLEHHDAEGLQVGRAADDSGRSASIFVIPT